MSQQGGRPTGQEDDWWRQLYGDGSGDTGPAPAPDSLDDRFASAYGTLNEARPPADTRPPADAPPGPAVPPAPGGAPGRAAPPAADAASGPRVPAPGPFPGGTAGAPRRPPLPPPRAPWEPPSAAPEDPAASAARAGCPGAAEPPPQDTAAGAATPPATEPSAPAAPPAPSAPAAPTSWTSAPLAAPVPPDTTYPPVPDGAPSTPPPPPGALPATGPRAPHPAPAPPSSRGHVGARPPTYDPEPTALPAADPDELDDLVPDTALDGARYGACTLRAASVRGDSARYRGEPRRDALLTARFGTGERALVLVAVATGSRTTPGTHRAAAEACRWIGREVGRSHVRLVEDIRAARRGDLKSGLQRLTDRSLGRLRAGAAERGLAPDAYAATLRCLLLPADPGCRTRVFFGVGPGGLFRLRDGKWQDIEPEAAEIRGEPVVGFGSPPPETPEGDRLTMDLGIPTPPSPYEPAPAPPREPFRFRTSVARPGDTLLMCGAGLADPLRGEEELRAHLADRWSRSEPPGLAAFLADTQVRVKGYADDRTAVAVWEA